MPDEKREPSNETTLPALMIPHFKEQIAANAETIAALGAMGDVKDQMIRERDQTIAKLEKDNADLLKALASDDDPVVDEPQTKDGPDGGEDPNVTELEP